MQLQLKSFFKITSTYAQNNNRSIKQKINNENLLYYVLFVLHNNKFKTKELQKNTITQFSLPIKKKKVIFLRAPYKNKLARLNIIQLQNTSFINFLNKNIIDKHVNLNTILNNKKIEFYKNVITNFSTQKIKHTKTIITTTNTFSQNFIIQNYL